MIELVGMPSNHIELVLNFFSGTSDVSIAFLFHSTHRILLGCDDYDAYLEGSKELLVEIYVLQLLNDKSYFTGSEAICFTAKLSTSAREALLVVKYRDDNWVIPVGYISLHVMTSTLGVLYIFSSHIFKENI